MKAMILAAGLGTRLRPVTEKTPKPLLPLTDRPLIDLMIGRLIAAGCEAVVINTHHLASMIKDFIQAQAYKIPVHTVYEPRLLDTGGAVKNVEDFWDDRPFLVINGDIFTDIDLEALYTAHLRDKPWVTMALHDHPDFNNVWVDGNGRIRGFGENRPCPAELAGPQGAPIGGPCGNSGLRLLAFTGIQVIDPRVLAFIPAGHPVGIIDVYCEMILRDLPVKACACATRYWYDIGTPDGYRRAASEAVVRQALAQNASIDDAHITWSSLKGDGSDRIWRRAECCGASVVLADHGPPSDQSPGEADAFVGIGRHLFKHGVSVPRIYAYHRPLGLVVLEDLGDIHLQDVVSGERDIGRIADHYRGVIDGLILMAVQGATGFHPGLTYQTPSYDRNLVLESEARYFCEAFLKGFMGLDVSFDALKNDFEALADNALNHSYEGLLHRDFQSRNILVHRGSYYIIDFQGARMGPLQYDLASLLIDPYVGLPLSLQDRLLAYYLDRLEALRPVDRSEFVEAYRYCAVNRNLQILGAFAFLSRVKKKTGFKRYIPAAVKTLKENLKTLPAARCARLKELVAGIAGLG